MNEVIRATLRSPETGVRLTGGLLERVFFDNISYLMRSFTLDDLAYPFRVRHGDAAAPRSRPLVPFWETELEGSNAGRFLMGAGNSLRYCKHAALRGRMDALVREIWRTREAGGYIMGFEKQDMMILERANYTRSWLTRGLIAAGRAGNGTAWELVRGFGDWFNAYPNAGKAAQLHLAYQGLIAHTSLGLSKVGTREDILSGERLYVEDDWLKSLAAGDTRSVWRRGNDGAHGYELNAMIAYLDLYEITGEKKYLDGVLGAHALFEKYWMHIGGSVAICEEHDGIFPYPPASRHLSADRHTGETCNNVWWLLLNKRLHALFPNEERYVAEMEKSLYNVLIPAQERDKGIRYHAYLHGVKDGAYAENTCCEGTATMLFGMLPELLYGLSDAGVWVDLFADSELSWTQEGVSCKLRMMTDFPADDHVAIRVLCDSPVNFDLNIRIPGWVEGPIALYLDGEIAATREPGGYCTLRRTWVGTECIEFVLKRSIQIHRYFGFTTVRGYERFAFMHGPVLMAATGAHEELPEELIAWNDKRGLDARAQYNAEHWVIDIDPAAERFSDALDAMHSLKPYYRIAPAERFTCYPLLRRRAAVAAISAREAYRTGLYREVPLSDGRVMLLAGIPEGEFRMGQEGFEPCEVPVHSVRISNPFFIGIFPVTQAQYAAIMGGNPSRHVGENLPVECVRWEDAEAFLERLNRRSADMRLRFRLPTEAEWEYAARAGSRDISGYATDVLRDFSQYGWTYQQLGFAAVQTQALPVSWPVGLCHQNAWGLYDMLGNVGEWCGDFYGPYGGAPQTDPAGPESGRLKCVRGGCYTDLATYCRCAARNALEPQWSNKYTGFRVAAEEIG